MLQNQTHPGHVYLPPAACALLHQLGRQDVPDPTIVVKLFTPWSGWTWYLTSAEVVMTSGRPAPLLDWSKPAAHPDGDAVEDVLCFGLVRGHETEWGYFSLTELAQLRGPGGLRVERDLHWQPTAFSECRELADIWRELTAGVSA